MGAASQVPRPLGCGRGDRINTGMPLCKTFIFAKKVSTPTNPSNASGSPVGMECRASTPEHPLDLTASELDMDRAAVGTIGLELGAVKLGQKLADLTLFKHAADSHRAVTSELLETIIESLLAPQLES